MFLNSSRLFFPVQFYFGTEMRIQTGYIRFLKYTHKGNLLISLKQRVAELNTNSSRPVSTRVIAVPVTEYRHQTAGYVGFKSAIRLRSGDVLGRFKLACSFIPLKPEANGLNSVVYATVNNDEGFVTTSAYIHPFYGFADYFNAFISSTRSTTAPTSFKITKPKINGSSLRILNPNPSLATSASMVSFKSNFATSNCDAYWDGVLYRNSVTATVANAGHYVDLKFGSPLNTSSEIIVYCYELTGQKNDPFLPVILESRFIVDPSSFYSNYAAVSSSADQISFSDFLSQTVETSPVAPVIPVDASPLDDNSLELLELLI